MNRIPFPLLSLGFFRSWMMRRVTSCCWQEVLGLLYVSRYWLWCAFCSVRNLTCNTKFFIPRNFLYSICYRIYSVYLYFGLTAYDYFLYSHPEAFIRLCGFVSHRFRGLSVSGHIVPLFPMCRKFFRFFLASLLHHHRHRLRLPYQSRFVFCSVLSVVFHLGCPLGFHPISRICRQVLVSNVSSSMLFRQRLWVLILFGVFSRSEIVDPK